MFNHSKQESIFFALISTALAAISSVAFKKLLEEMPYQEIALVESVFLCLFFGLQKGYRLTHLCAWDYFYLIGGCLLNAGGYLCFFLSLQHLSPIEFSFLGRHQATLSILIGWLFLGEKHTVLSWLAIGFALAGAYCFTFVDFYFNQSLVGVAFAFFYCLFFALRGLFVKLGPQVPVPTLLFWGCVANLLATVGTIYGLNPINISWERAFLSSKSVVIILTALVTQGIGIHLYFKALYLGQLSSVSSIRAISPFFVACYSMFLFEYEWTLVRFIGLLFCTFSILLFVLSMHGFSLKGLKYSLTIKLAHLVKLGN